MVTKKTTINQLKTMFDNLESKFEKEILILKQESINMSKRINTLENKFGSNDVLDVKCETNEISNDKSYIKEIEIGPSEKIKDLHQNIIKIGNMKYKGNSKMIPVVKITNGQFKQLENYIHQMKIPINFIIFGTRKEYFYYFNNEAGPKIKEKKSNYKFGNAVGIEYSGKIFSLDLDNIKQE